MTEVDGFERELEVKLLMGDVGYIVRFADDMVEWQNQHAEGLQTTR